MNEPIGRAEVDTVAGVERYDIYDAKRMNDGRILSGVYVDCAENSGHPTWQRVKLYDRVVIGGVLYT
ncbi:hypothetical protein [Actinomadura rubrisoli]|uniref:Uncharacterized protein n=1 Tax=Actinomadura rubrisoli TaxID=2530368 RepID=A0A4R5CB66_9ACTN|nr:hypothetical protein [Actinomadura rubrisoli]TDD97188.1 hypothetical protein E1298_01765 [Actinomadura rubrisoli]